MDQIHNHYHGPITVQGANFQSHYVPAEKPYAVYVYVWEGPTAAIAQLIGTVLVGEVNKEGKVCFDGKPVYRMPQKSMLDFDHCFIPEDMGPLVADPIHLGFVGDTIGKDKLVKVLRMSLKEGDGASNVKAFINDMELAGLKVELGEGCGMEDVTGDFDEEYDRDTKKCDHYLVSSEEIALRVKIWQGEGKSDTPEKVLETLCFQIEHWQEVGITFKRIKMKDCDADYQEQVDELLELARLYGKYKELSDKSGRLYYLLSCRESIGKDRCFYDDFVMGMQKVHWGDYTGYDKDLEWAISVGLAERDGNIIQFSPDFERMATWQWTWKHGEDKR